MLIPHSEKTSLMARNECPDRKLIFLILVPQVRFLPGHQ
jgi:hypothetical protein